MIASADTVIQPLAMVIEPVDAIVADKAMATTREQDHRASWADLLRLELLKQVHHADAMVALNDPGSKTLHDGDEKQPDKHDAADYRLKPLLLLLNHVWKDQHHERYLANEHRREIANHGLTRSLYLMCSLLELERTFYALTASFIDFHSVFYQDGDRG